MSPVDDQVAVTWHQQCQDWFAAHPDLKEGAEVGVWVGSLSRRLLDIGVQSLLLVDPWRVVLELTDHGPRIWGPGYSDDEMEAAFQSVWDWSKTESRVKVIRMESLRAARYVNRYSLDFVILDARHDYAAVKDDIEAWLPKIKCGGYLVGDDYTAHFPGVGQAVQEVFGERAVVASPMWWVQV